MWLLQQQDKWHIDMGLCGSSLDMSHLDSYLWLLQQQDKWHIDMGL
jgi:hypothetical protein